MRRFSYNYDPCTHVYFGIVTHNYPKPKKAEVEDLSFLAVDGYDPDAPPILALSCTSTKVRIDGSTEYPLS